jgi:hypothetical protein
VIVHPNSSKQAGFYALKIVILAIRHDIIGIAKILMKSASFRPVRKYPDWVNRG